MKKKSERQVTETIRGRRGIRILGSRASGKENNVDDSISQCIKQELHLHQYFQEGKVYAFTVCACISDQMADGTQQTKYILNDKRGEKHYFYCDCTCFQGKKEVYLRIKEISGGRLKFARSILERLDEVFLKGQEYEFEVISCKNKRCVVCDVQIGKNHHLIIDDGQFYERGVILKLEVQGYDHKGNLLLIDRNPPAPVEPCINSLQIMAETVAKSPQIDTPQVLPKENPHIFNHHQSNLSGIPKVAPSIAIPREDKRVLVEDLGYKIPKKTEKYVPRLHDPKPVYIPSISQPQVKQLPKPQHEYEPEPKPESAPQPEHEPEPKPESAPHPEHEPELLTEELPRPCKFPVIQVFMSWMDGVTGMEKTEDYTVYSGHAEEMENSEIPVYQQQILCGDEAKEVHILVKPWYVRVWLFVNRYFSRN